MRLFVSPSSPYSRKVRVAIMELGLADEVQVLHVKPLEPNNGLRELNPLGKVPTLITEDETVLFDSPMIVRYLDRLSGAPKYSAIDGLSPQELRLEPLGDGMTDAAFSIVMEKNRPSSQRSLFWLNRWSEAIQRSLQLLQQDLTLLSSDWRAGQIAVACGLEYLDFRHSVFRWRENFPELSDWLASCVARPSMRETRFTEP